MLTARVWYWTRFSTNNQVWFFIKTSSWATNCGKWVSNSHTLCKTWSVLQVCHMWSAEWKPSYHNWKGWINTRELPLTLPQSKILSNQSSSCRNTTWIHAEWNAIYDIAIFSIYYPCHVLPLWPVAISTYFCHSSNWNIAPTDWRQFEVTPFW